MTRLLRTLTTGQTTAGSRRRRTRIVGRVGALAVLLAGGAGLASGTPAAAAGSPNWPSYLFNTNHSSYSSAATSIGTGNLGNLQPVANWMPFGVFLASPTVFNGVVYIGGDNGYFYAVKLFTHTVMWSKFMGVTPNAECGQVGIVSTATVANNPTTGETVYVNAPNGQLYALNASTGAVIWQATVDTPSTTLDDYYSWSSPLVANGHVYVGISSSCDDPLVPAGMLEFNQATGALLATWHSLPNGQVGASVWSTPATSTLGDGSIFVTTGNINTNPQPLYAESIVRLSGSNLSLLDSWQVPASQQVGDSDFGGSPTDFTANLNGTPTAMVGACNKNGIYYAFRQNNLAAGPVWQWKMANAYGTAPNPMGQCDAAALWDGTNLIEGGGNNTTVNGTSYQGSVQSLNPATGTPVWQTGLPGAVIGSPTEDGSGVVAAPVFESSTGNLGVYLLSASTGAILDYIGTNPSQVWAQPVFTGSALLVAGNGLTAYEITTPGSPVTAVAPNTIGQGVTETVTLTGSGFSGAPSVFVSGALISASSVVVRSSTQLQVTLSVGPRAATGARNITVIEPGLTADTCSGCLTIDPAPVVSNLSPGSLAVSTTTPVTVTGSNFASGLTVTTTIPGATAGTPTNVTPTSFTVDVTVPASVATGNYVLMVTNPDGGTGSAALSVT
jgi:outer membrane protein assembly factor BamB